MLKNLNSRTVETTNFVEGRDRTYAATAVWAPEFLEQADEIIQGHAGQHRANALDESYTDEFGQGEVFEYELPGLRVVALLTGGTLCTVFTVSDDAAVRLHRAVRNARPVTITYTKADGIETVRTIEPTALALTKSGAVLVKAADRLSGEKRSFRLDRVSAYTVHRTRFTVRLEAPAPTKAELVEAFQATTAPRVRLEGRGWTGHLDLSTEAFGPSGWSAKVTLDPEFSHLAVSGTLRVGYDDLVHI